MGHSAIKIDPYQKLLNSSSESFQVYHISPLIGKSKTQSSHSKSLGDVRSTKLSSEKRLQSYHERNFVSILGHSGSSIKSVPELPIKSEKVAQQMELSKIYQSIETK